jgi:DNA-binding beta-propeller fold protein YncE
LEVLETVTSYLEVADQKNINEAKRRKNRLLVLLILLLLLLLLTLGILYFLLFTSPLTRPVKKGKFEFLFSIYGLTKPMFVSIDKKENLYVSDTANARLLVFDNQGRYLRRIGGDAKYNRVYAPYGTYVDNKAKRLYVADYTSHLVKVYRLRGKKILFTFPKDPGNRRAYGKGAGFTPFGIAEYKNRLYITSNNGIFIFSKKGKLIKKWKGRGRGLSKFDFPNGIAIDKRNGTIFVTDVLNRRVKALSANGAVKWVLGKPDVKAKIVSFFALPRGITINTKRNYLYITDTFANHIVVLDEQGRLISVLGKRGTDDGKFNFPEGIVAGANDVFYVADRENNRIQALKMVNFPPPSKEDLKKYRGSFIKAKD